MRRYAYDITHPKIEYLHSIIEASQVPYTENDLCGRLDTFLLAFYNILTNAIIHIAVVLIFSLDSTFPKSLI